jgi:hypothetical protein
VLAHCILAFAIIDARTERSSLHSELLALVLNAANNRFRSTVNSQGESHVECDGPRSALAESSAKFAASPVEALLASDAGRLGGKFCDCSRNATAPTAPPARTEQHEPGATIREET